jgi:heat shock protein HslJ
MRRLVVILLLALSLGLGGCGVMPGVAPNLESTGWRAVQVWGREPVAGREPTLLFGDGTVSGSTGCNDISGLFALDRGRFQITDLSGVIACRGDGAELEALFVKALLSAEDLRFEGGNLVIAGPGGEVAFRSDSTVTPRTPVLNRDESRRSR